MGNLTSLTEDESPVLAKLRDEGLSITPVYRYLAHAPELLPAWAGFATAMRTPTATPEVVRELAILRLAHLLSSDRQWSHHEHAALNAGLSEEALAGLTGPADNPAFSKDEQAVLRLVDEMIGDFEVRHATFEAVLDAYGPAVTVELVLLVGYHRALAGIVAAFGLK